MSDEISEMQRAAINGVLDRLNTLSTYQPEGRSDCDISHGTRIVCEAADLIRRVRGEPGLSPGAMIECGPVVDMEKAREGLEALRAMNAQVVVRNSEQWRREVEGVVLRILAIPGDIGRELRDEIEHAFRRF